MTTWYDICAFDDVPALGARTVRIGAREIAVFRTADDAVFALENKCPHKGGPLAEGIVHGRKVGLSAAQLGHRPGERRGDRRRSRLRGGIRGRRRGRPHPPRRPHGEARRRVIHRPGGPPSG